MLDVAQEGRNAGEAPGTLADAQRRIERALVFLESLEPNSLDVNGESSLTLELPDGATFDMTRIQFIRD